MLIILVALVGVPILVFLTILATFLPLWIRVRATQTSVALLDLVMMRLRGLDPEQVVDAMIFLGKAGLPQAVGDLEAHLLAGGNLNAVTEALISAAKAGLDMDFHRLAAIDLAGRDVVQAVMSRVKPRVIVIPPADSPSPVITGVCQDGVRLGIRARVTVRTELERLVGGAGDSTIVARVGEGIITAIGRAATHKEILELPETITKYLLSRGLDSGTCLEIVSVDIADVDVMGNIGATLQSAQADADKRVAQAKAEMRRAAAVASHQEMQARTAESHTRVVAANAEVPFAVSASLAEGCLGSPAPVAALVHGRMRWKLIPGS
ncbi:MAG: UPF0365 family protein [Kiritimatiellaeota bacterium]|nr:UPF0365 family protein [Kiritimatiellota bacterium]